MENDYQNWNSKFESKEHYDAKIKLYKIMKNKSYVTFKDQNGKLFNVYQNNNSFVELEHPIYERDQKYTGLLRVDYKKNPIVVADICYGYNGEYKVFIEINHKHSCEQFKINFCKHKKITVLEIPSERVLSLDYSNTGIIKVENLSFPKGSDSKNFLRKNYTIDEIIYHLESDFSDAMKKIKDKILRGEFYYRDDLNRFLRNAMQKRGYGENIDLDFFFDKKVTKVYQRMGFSSRNIQSLKDYEYDTYKRLFGDKEIVESQKYIIFNKNI